MSLAHRSQYQPAPKCPITLTCPIQQGCVIASRLAEYLPNKKILLIEAGPSDFTNDRVLDLKQWLSLLGGELDYDYGTTEQPMGRSIYL